MNAYIKGFRKEVKNKDFKFVLFFFGCLILIPVVILVNTITRFLDAFSEWLIEKHGFAIVLFIIALLVLILIVRE